METSETNPGTSFINRILMACRDVMLISTNYKLCVYIVVLLSCSILPEVGVPIPRTYFADPSNTFNVYFVKLGWGWTVALVAAYIVLTASVYCAGEPSRVFHHFCRTFADTTVWILCSFVIYLLKPPIPGTSTPTSELHSMTTESSESRKWFQLDISGHSFLLIFCNLCIGEELSSLRNWASIEDIVWRDNGQADDEDPAIGGGSGQPSPSRSRQSQANSNNNELTDEQRRIVMMNYQRFTPGIYMLFGVITVLAIVWDFMIICTALYFHTMLQKAVGALMAILCWCLTYKLCYPRGIIAPSPGVGVVRYMSPRSSKGRSRRATLISHTA